MKTKIFFATTIFAFALTSVNAYSVDYADIPFDNFHIDRDNVNGGDIHFTEDDASYLSAKLKKHWLEKDLSNQSYTFVADIAFHDGEKRLVCSSVPIHNVAFRKYNRDRNSFRSTVSSGNPIFKSRGSRTHRYSVNTFNCGNGYEITGNHNHRDTLNIQKIKY